MHNEKRVESEILHGKKLASNAEDIWGWASPGGVVRANRRAELLIKEGKITSQDTCLEIGCGSALFTEKIYNAVKPKKIVAIDISEDLLNLARQKQLPVEFRIEDAMNLSFENATFDVVYGSSVIHHLDMKKAMQEMYRVLKSGGRIIFAEPNMLNPQIFMQKNIPFVKKWMGDSPDETAIVRWQFSKLLKEIGFTEVKIYPYDFLHPITPKFMIPFINGLSKGLEKIPLIKEIAGSVIIYAKK